jgi:predicted RNA-binding Zn-ribbon protein involved in translation (DUF1610 family)
VGAQREVDDVATVRASCPTCGDVEMTIRDVQVQLCATTASSSYSFLCPACRLLVNKTATEQVVEILVNAGVRVVEWTLPAELTERRDGPAVTHDDLLGFHFALAEPGWLESQLADLDRAAPPGSSVRPV